MTCKDCVHYEVCKEVVEFHHGLPSDLEVDGIEKRCDHFKPKSRFVELPCEVGQKGQIIVTGTVEKPYFELLYYEESDKEWKIGYSSYDIANVFRWKQERIEEA